MIKFISKKGDTLIEVLVASIILFMVMGPTLYVVVLSQTTVDDAGTEANATYIIKDWFESIKKNDDLKTLCEPAGNIGLHIGENKALLYTIDSVNYKLYFEKTLVTLDGSAVSPTNVELLQLTAHVKWKIKKRDKHIAMTMLSSEYE